MSGPKNKPLDLAISLLRDHATTRAADQQFPDLSDAEWRRFIAFTSSHFILPAIAEPLQSRMQATTQRPDAAAFIAGLFEQNRSRNTDLKTATLELARALNRQGIVPTALKGAAFLLDDTADAAPWRFMGDIDLLIHEHELADSINVIEQLGFTQSGEDYDPTTQAHFPPLISPCQTFSIELHTRLFGLDDFDIALDGLRNESSPVPGLACRIAIPSTMHRIAHALAHAQLHNRNYLSKRLVLKDIHDLSKLCANADGTTALRQAVTLFQTKSNALAVKALICAWAEMMAIEPAIEIERSQRHWSTTARNRLDWSRSRTIANLPFDLARQEWLRLRSERGHLLKRARQAISPSAFSAAAQNFCFKQSNRLWR